MHKVMVVDDEPIVRLALKSLANWENHGFDLSFEAFNGKQALELLKKNPDIDIVITDINMPVMDGLELISRLKERGDGIGIVVLSAYDDYNFVRQAFKLGVMDYILKTDMEPDNILKILKGIVSRIKKTDLSHTEKASQERDTKLMKERFLKELIEQDEIADPESRAADLNIRICKDCNVLCCLLIDGYKEVSERYDGSNQKLLTASVQNAVNQILTETKSGEVLVVTPEEYIVFFSFPNASPVHIREKIVEVLGKIKYSLRMYINIGVSIGVSTIKTGLAESKQLYKEASANARLRFVFGKGRIIFPEYINNIPKKEVNTLIGKETGVVSALRELNKEKIIENLEKLFDILKNSNIDRIDNTYACYMEVVFLIISCLKERNEDIGSILGENVNLYNTITKFETQEEINEWLKETVRTVVDRLTDKRDAKVNRTVTRVQEFVKDNYNKDITLKAASDYVGLSESHLSYVFTKMTGETFTDYVTRIRIEKAKELLEMTNMKVYEVSVNVGYANVEHFSRVFKKITGISPNSYKSL
jgi:YesN/AraC family two-component response regulator